MFEAHVLGYTSPFRWPLARVLWFSSLLVILGSGLRFSWSGFRVTRNHFWVSQSVSCPGPVLAIPRFLIRSRSRDF